MSLAADVEAHVGRWGKPVEDAEVESHADEAAADASSDSAASADEQRDDGPEVEGHAGRYGG